VNRLAPEPPVCPRLSPAIALALLVSLLGVLAPRAAAAFELKLPGTDRSIRVVLTQTLITEYHYDTDVFDANPPERYVDFKNRTDIVLMHGTTTLNVRFDANAFAGTEETSKHLSGVSLEKISLSSIQRTFDVTAGDFYVRIGRGLALDLTRINELFRDSTLRGAEARIRTRYVSGHVFGGWVNPLDVDDFTEVPVHVPSDVIGGVRIEVRPRPEISLALHYVGGGMQAQTGTSRNATHTLGVSFEIPSFARRVSFYGEFDYMNRAQEMEILHGMGSYFSAAGNFGPLAALLEFKYYSQLRFFNAFGSDVDTFVYNRPPTLTRTRAEVLNNHDTIGPRLKLDLRVGPRGTVVYVNYGIFYLSDARPGEDFFTNGAVSHDAYAGIQQPLPGGALDLSGGYRVDARDVGGEKVTDYSAAFFDGELSFIVYRGHTMELEVQYRKIEKAARSFWDFYIAVGYRPNKWVSGGFAYEYSTEYQAPTPDASVRTHFGGVRATVNFSPSSYARLFGGSTHGGVRCIDGFCREFPPFIGVKLELVVQL
jgi:hypothetical protein